MNREDVKELEEACEHALIPVIHEVFEDLPPRIVHLMAKAAVAVVEAAMEHGEE
ncbi:MAG: hypothetical protein WAO83_14795 [Fuerstiella sp.]